MSARRVESLDKCCSDRCEKLKDLEYVVPNRANIQIFTGLLNINCWNVEINDGMSAINSFRIRFRGDRKLPTYPASWRRSFNHREFVQGNLLSIGQQIPTPQVQQWWALPGHPCTEKVDMILKWILSWSWSGPKFASLFISQFLSQVWSQLCYSKSMNSPTKKKEPLKKSLQLPPYVLKECPPKRTEDDSLHTTCNLHWGPAAEGGAPKY